MNVQNSKNPNAMQRLGRPCALCSAVHFHFEIHFLILYNHTLGIKNQKNKQKRRGLYENHVAFSWPQQVPSVVLSLSLRPSLSLPPPSPAPPFPEKGKVLVTVALNAVFIPTPSVIRINSLRLPTSSSSWGWWHGRNRHTIDFYFYLFMHVFCLVLFFSGVFQSLGNDCAIWSPPPT